MKKATITFLMIVAFSYLYHANSKDMVNIGEKYGRLTVISFEQQRGEKAKAICLCACGNKTSVVLKNLSTGNTKSCGCYRNTFKRTHGLSGHKLKHIWLAMKSRCYNPKNQRYNNYGARGVEVCDSWRDDYVNFYNWAISSGYKNGLTIDRCDVNGNYDPSNCKWSTYAQQASNTTRNRYHTVDGVTKHLNAWARFYGITPSSLRKRMRVNGYSFEMALYTKAEPAQTT